MKTNLLATIGATTFLCGLLACSSPAQVVTGNEHVRIEVRVQTGQERKSEKGSRVDTVTQQKTLTILLSGKARTPETRKGTWQAYGRDMKDNTIVPLESGTFDLDFAKGPQKVETAQIATTYTPEHAASSGKGGKGGGNQGNRGASTKKVPAEGKKFVGYGVTVKDGEKVVGEYFDPPGLKAEAAKK